MDFINSNMTSYLQPPAPKFCIDHQPSNPTYYDSYRNGHVHSRSLGYVPQPQFNYGYSQPAVYSNHQHSSSHQPIVLSVPPGMFYNGNVNNMNNNNYAIAPLLKPASILAPIQPNAVPNNVNGGVNTVLDYDPEIISDFVVKYALLAFEAENSYSQYESNDQSISIFTKSVYSVLNATRLPSVSIFQALHFLSKYLDKLPEGAKSIGGNSINVIYQNTMIALVLANKFNDDKTFTNKSWSEATGMNLLTINEYEREWLKVLEWNLFDDKFVLYENYVESYEIFCRKKMPPASPCSYTGYNMSNNNVPTLGSEFETPSISTSNINSSPYYYNDEEFNYRQQQKRLQQNDKFIVTPVSTFSPPQSSNNSSYFLPSNNNVDYSGNYMQNNYQLKPPMQQVPQFQQFPKWSRDIPNYENYQQNVSQNLFNTNIYNKPVGISMEFN